MMKKKVVYNIRLVMSSFCNMLVLQQSNLSHCLSLQGTGSRLQLTIYYTINFYPPSSVGVHLFIQRRNATRFSMPLALQNNVFIKVLKYTLSVVIILHMVYGTPKRDLGCAYYNLFTFYVAAILPWRNREYRCAWINKDVYSKLGIP